MIVRIITYMCFFVSFFNFGQNQDSRFKHLSMEEGLSQTSISCILRDSRGFMWFGTEDGLNKYDGTNFTIYRHKPKDNNSLSSSYINAIAEDRDGFLWIGTKNGLNYFDPDTESFRRYHHDPNDQRSLSHNEIYSLLKVHDDYLIIGTLNGLNILQKKEKFLRYRPDDFKSPYYAVTATKLDLQGNLWVLSTTMLEKFEFNGLSLKKAFEKQLKNSIASSLLLDSLHVWIGSTNGLSRFNKETKAYKVFQFYEKDGNKDKRDHILAIADTGENNLLLGAHGGGLIRFNKLSGNFNTVTHTPFNQFSLNSNAVRSLYLDDNDILWVGTYGGGINKYDPHQFEFSHYKYAPADQLSLSENSIRAILEDTEEELWIGTHNGLNRMNRKANKVEVYQYDPLNSSTISSNVVRSLKQDSKGTIWAGTWNNGLNSFNKESGKFDRIVKIPNSIDSIKAVRAL